MGYGAQGSDHQLCTGSVEAQTGRDISVGGDAELKIFPNLVVVADQVSVANADWSDRGAMMSADRLDASIRKR